MGLDGFQLQNVHMRASSDEVNEARRKLMANMAEMELARKVKAVVEAAPQGSLAEQENTQEDEGSVSTPCKKGTGLSKKGKEKMSLDEMVSILFIFHVRLPIADLLSLASSPLPVHRATTTGNDNQSCLYDHKRRPWRHQRFSLTTLPFLLTTPLRPVCHLTISNLTNP